MPFDLPSSRLPIIPTLPPVLRQTVRVPREMPSILTREMLANLEELEARLPTMDPTLQEILRRPQQPQLPEIPPQGLIPEQLAAYARQLRSSTLNLSVFRDLTPQHIVELRNCLNILILHLPEGITPEHIAALAGVRNIQYLHIAAADLNAENLVALRQCPRIWHLYIRGPGITAEQESAVREILQTRDPNLPPIELHIR